MNVRLWTVWLLVIAVLSGCAGCDSKQPARMRNPRETGAAPPDEGPAPPDQTPAPPDQTPAPPDQTRAPPDKMAMHPDDVKRFELPPFRTPKIDLPPPEESAFPEFDSPNKSLGPPSRVTRVPIYYATDRRRLADKPNEFYGTDRADDSGPDVLQFGLCLVAIPPKHRSGEIEQPSLWRLEVIEDPTKHVTLLQVQPVAADKWLASLQHSVARTPSRSALVFVHGFNVSFAAAARRTAQMKFDLQFDGAAVLYSWPAPTNYAECENNVDWTRSHLLRFLSEYVHQSGAQRIHLVAHSMGTRVLTTALAELVQTQPALARRYNQIVLAAPDIDAGVFKHQIAPRIARAAERISIYASSQDLALVASKKVHKYVRLGEGGDRITVFPELPQLEVLDASAINESLLGHSYYGDSPTILNDIQQVLAGLSAERRGLLRRGACYALVPR